MKCSKCGKRIKVGIEIIPLGQQCNCYRLTKLGIDGR